MADKKITDLPSLTVAEAADQIPIVDDSANVTKRVAAANIVPIDSVDYTKWTNNVSFIAAMSTGTSVGASAFTKMAFNTVLADRGSNFTTTTNRFIAPVAGEYSVSAGLSLPSASGNHRAILALYKNGTEVRRLQDVGIIGATARGISGAGDVTLAAGDYIEIFGWYDVAVAMGDNNVTTSWFSGHLVSPQ